MTDLWQSSSCQDWNGALADYEACITRHDNDLLSRRDAWYRNELPGIIASRSEPYVTREELIWVAEWKMARGVWRARNLHLARQNTTDEVEAASRGAFDAVPDDRKALKLLGSPRGVGPATASAVLAAYRPERYPFFDEVVAAQVPGLQPGEFTVKAYLAYGEALRQRAAELSAACGTDWTVQAVGLALWAAAGGKLAR